MANLLRALALALAFVTAHVSSLVSHHGAAPSAPPSPKVSAREQSLAHARLLRTEWLLALTTAPPRPALARVAIRLPLSGAPARSWGHGAIASIIQQAFAPLGTAAVAWAERVAMCESGDNPDARNASGASGLFQIMPGTWAGTPEAHRSIFDPVANAAAAEWIYAHRGAGAWSCR